MADNKGGNIGDAGGARLRDVPKSLEEVNDLLSDMTTKLGNLASIPALQVNVKPYDDLVRKFELLTKLNKKWGSTLYERAKNEKDIATKISEQRKIMDRLKKDEDDILIIKQKKGKINKEETKELKYIGRALEDQKKNLDELQKSASQIDTEWGAIGKLIAQDVLGGITAIGKSILTLSLDAFVGAINLVKKGFLAVYDLVDRTVRATGEFRENLGASTAGMAQLEKEGWKLEGSLRGLSNAELGIGLKELAGAAHGFGLLDKNLESFRITAVKAGKEMGIGSEAAGEMAKTFYQMGGGADKIGSYFNDIEDAANEAGIPVSDFAKDINSAKNSVAAFGLKGRKVFLDAYAYVRRLGISIQSLERFTDMTDTFEGAAQAAAKMNAVFGTSIDAMGLMLENDPAKRFEMVKKAMIGQGKTAENLSRQEIKFAAEQIGITEEEFAGAFKLDGGLKKFQARKKKANEDEVASQKRLQQAMLTTAQTINNWGATWDQVTKAIKPIIDDIFGPNFFKDLPGRIQQVIAKIKEFVNIFAENEEVKAFTKEIRKDFAGLFDLLVNDGPITGKALENVNIALSTIVKTFNDIYDIFKWLVQNKNVLSGIFESAANVATMGGFTAAKNAVQVATGRKGVGEALADVSTGGAFSTAKNEYDDNKKAQEDAANEKSPVSMGPVIHLKKGGVKPKTSTVSTPVASSVTPEQNQSTTPVSGNTNLASKKQTAAIKPTDTNITLNVAIDGTPLQQSHIRTSLSK